MLKSYEETISWLFEQFPSYQNIGANAYKPSLDNISKLMESFGNPHNDLQFIHVAGTNGKGSTCSMLASVLTESNYKVGLFTSPHIHDFRERIRVNGKMVSEPFIIESTNAIRSKQLDFEPSFFEITFLLSILYFKEQECDICVIETGLGGRLDATNVIYPILSLITNISIEHTQFLGNTLELIAREKAGIIKQNTPVVIGETDDATKDVFLELAQLNNATIYFSDTNKVDLPNDFPLIGDYQQQNFALVTSGLSLLASSFPISENAIERGLKNLNQNSGLQCRLQLMSKEPLIIYDVSHNTAGIKATLATIQKMTTGKLHLVYGTSSDKDLPSIFELFPKEASYYFTTFSNARSAKKEQLEQISNQFSLNAHFFDSPLDALTLAQNTANKEDSILVFGSFFLIADFF